MSTETELSSEKEPVGKRKSIRKKPPPKSKGNKKSVTTSISSSEDLDEDYVPQNMKIMGATAVGTIGIDSVRYVEKKRRKSRNLNGVVSNRIRVRLKRATEVINTLMYKAEAKGDPAQLRSINRELEIQVNKLKRDDELMRKEMDGMRALIEGFRKEISDLKDKLNHAEEDKRKVSERQSSIQYKSSRVSHVTDENRLNEDIPTGVEGRMDLPRDCRLMDLPGNLIVAKNHIGSHRSDPMVEELKSL
ncbi:unnamed protein product [Lasius platythorax]|uniref:Uncharacterized protein n=1 Tax=Lasius platythorax TaxID=488582 RepID=A0AAV2NXP3_9HYME